MKKIIFCSLFLLHTIVFQATYAVQSFRAVDTFPAAFKSVNDLGAIGDGKADDSIAIQKAMDTGETIILKKGVYRIKSTLFIKSHNTVLMGHGPNATLLVYEGEGPAIANESSQTKYWCRLSNMKIIATNKNQKGPIVKWHSIQFGELENIWIAGNGKDQTIGLSILAIPSKTEATYNEIRHAYIGLVRTGILFGYGANSNTVAQTRVQPLPNGVAIHMQGVMSNNHIVNSGFEYPGNVSGGIYIDHDVHNTLILGNRFEGLSYAWKINKNNQNTTVIGNYYSLASKNKWEDNGTKTQNFDSLNETSQQETEQEK